MSLRKASVLLLLILFGSLPFSPAALERSNLLFYLPFENSLMPAVCQGTPEIKLKNFSFPFKGSFHDKQEADVEKKKAKNRDGGLAFVPGRKGMGLNVIEDRNRSKVYSFPCVQYQAKESLPHREGTLSVWVKPVGWGGDEDHRYFIALTADNCVIRLYVYSAATYAWVDGRDKYILVGGGKWAGWKPGRWAFLAFTFKPGQQSFYVNGKLMTTISDGLIEPSFTNTGIVEISEGSQVIDELMIFDRALLAKEIIAIYRANLTADESADGTAN